MKITDDTLNKEYFTMLQGVVMGHNFPWEYQARVANPWENNNEHFILCIDYMKDSLQ